MTTVPENETKLLEPYAYISELPGKGVRGKMIGAFQTWLRAPSEAVESIQRIVDQLHNASLLCAVFLPLLGFHMHFLTIIVDLIVVLTTLKMTRK